MLARIAHELFWLGRNLVRAEHTARMLDGVFSADLQGRPDDPNRVTLGWGSILAIMGGEVEDARAVRRDDVLSSLTLDPDNPTSVVSCIGRAREGAGTVRDVISTEMWEAINTTNLTLLEGDLSARLRTGPYSVYQYVKERSALIWGTTSRTMLRDEASAFLAAGGRIESADMVLRMLRVALPIQADVEDVGAVRDGQAIALLAAVGGVQAFRRAVPGQPNALPVANFLLYERAYPDSVAASVEATLNVLQRADSSPRTSEPILRLSRLGADLDFQARTEGGTLDLGATCEAVQQELARVDQDIADRYFAGAASPGVVTSSS
ncbi:MAG: alpha-E protein [Solirubrobacterales bacterium]|nr:alpha-E protein [Solirubrobacterales bacterium]